MTEIEQKGQVFFTVMPSGGKDILALIRSMNGRMFFEEEDAENYAQWLNDKYFSGEEVFAIYEWRAFCWEDVDPIHPSQG